MNIDARTTGTPTGVHNGGDNSYWTGSEIIGNKATFDNSDTAGDLPIAGSQQILWNNGQVLDTIQFDAGSLIPMTGFGVVTLQTLVDSDWAENDSIEFYGWNTASGAIRGNRIALEDYFTPGNFDTVQNLSIPLVEMGLSAEEDMDAFRMQIVQRDGPKSPKVYFDTIQLEETAQSVDTVFKAEPNKGTIFRIEELIISVADVGTGGTAMAYDKLGALSTLSNGLTFESLRTEN